MLEEFVNWALQLTANLGYWGVMILMMVESSFIPFPSEIVVPPAAYLASLGQMNVFLVVAAGVAGSVLGAVINYVLAASLGRLVIYKISKHRWAKFIFLSPDKVERAEKYFLKNSNSATFWGRLIPVFRQLVSIPAGFCKMPFGRFVLLTAGGSAIWVSILAALGYFIGANQEILKLYYEEISWAILIIAAGYIVYKIYRHRKKKRPIQTASSDPVPPAGKK